MVIYPKSLIIVWNALYNLESCFLLINLFTPKKGKVGPLQLGNLRISEIYAVVPSSGKKEYCFAVDYKALIQIKYKNILCVTGNMCTTVREMWTLTVYLNIKEMLISGYNDGIAVVVRKNPCLNVYLTYL